MAALLIVISAVSFAKVTTEAVEPSAKPNFRMVPKSDVKFDLYYTSEESGEVCVTIYDDQGRRVSSKTIDDVKNFKRTYNFSNLNPGKYKIVVRNESGTANQIISYLVKPVKLQAFVSKAVDGSSIKLHVGDFDKNEPVLVKIYSQNKLIHSEKIKNAKSFSRVYDFNGLPLKSVRVTIINAGERKTFNHTLDSK